MGLREEAEKIAREQDAARRKVEEEAWQERQRRTIEEGLPPLVALVQSVLGGEVDYYRICHKHAAGKHKAVVQVLVDGVLLEARNGELGWDPYMGWNDSAWYRVTDLASFGEVSIRQNRDHLAEDEWKKYEG